jgi:hypothetical protein
MSGTNGALCFSWYAVQGMHMQMELNSAKVKNFLLLMAALDASSLTILSSVEDHTLGCHFFVLSSVRVCSVLLTVLMYIQAFIDQKCGN